MLPDKVETMPGDQSTRYRNELLNHVIDDYARHEPERLYAEIPFSPTTYASGLRKVTYSAFANAIDGLAWWLHRTLGPGKDFETLCYIGPNDLRHNILLLGAVKAGYKALLTSPRFSARAQITLIKSLGCKVMLEPAVRPPITNMILEANEMSVYQIPELEYLFDHKHQHYAFEKTFEKARGEPLVVLHSSGTTGFPKPLIWTHDWAAAFRRDRNLAPPPGFESSDKLLLGAAHIFGSLMFTMFCGTTMIYPLSGLPPTADVILSCLQHTTIDAITLIPPQAEEIGRSPTIITTIASQTNAILYGGGEISSRAGDAIAEHMKLFTSCGSTEMGLWHSLRPIGKGWEAGMWRWMRFHPSQNIQFRLQDTIENQNLYEAVVVRNTESIDAEQPVFKLAQYSQLPEYCCGDLFSPHPEDPESWEYRGRKDDMQVFSSAEKYYPTAMEAAIAMSHPAIEEVLLIGTGRSQAALLVEMRESVPPPAPTHEEAVEQIWKGIEAANKTCPPTAQITKQHVRFTTAEKPLVRTAKGSVQRSASVEAYQKELNMLFEKAQEEHAEAPPTTWMLMTGKGS
ncbi:hypothetical protein MMC17_003831 [Xylographa soralifera]|nr:hypothetical protein [Xylographa soralifera]